MGTSVTLNGTSPMTIAASATGTGTTIAKVLTAATTNATSVATGSRRLYGMTLGNTSAGWRYVRLYNLAVAPTVGTSSPVMVIPIPPGGAANLEFVVPVSFSTGLAYAITAAAADLDTTVTVANDVVGTILYA